MGIISSHQFELRLLLAFILGAAIGFERQYKRKIAGMPTYALVSVGSALFVLVALNITGDSSGAGRVVSQIITGIGFLGAGVIMKEGINVTGINTAATVWCVGAIGSLAGMGLWYQATIGTAFILAANIGLRPLGKLILSQVTSDAQGNYRYKLNVTCKISGQIAIRNQVLDLLNSTHLVMASMGVDDAGAQDDIELNFELHSRIDQRATLDSLIHKIQQSEFLIDAEWTAMPDND